MEFGSYSGTYLTLRAYINRIWNSIGDIPSCIFAILNFFNDFMNFNLIFKFVKEKY